MENEKADSDGQCNCALLQRGERMHKKKLNSGSLYRCRKLLCDYHRNAFRLDQEKVLVETEFQGSFRDERKQIFLRETIYSYGNHTFD